MGLSFTSDIIDENWNSNVTYHDVLESAYVVPTMYAVLVLGGWGSYLDVLRTNNVTSGMILSPVLNVTQDNNVLAIKSKPAFIVPYLVIISAIFIAHWTSGLFIRKVYVTEWAPLWFGLLSDDEQDNVKEQIRGSNIFESKGLKKIDMGNQLTGLLSDLETDSKH